MSLEKTIQKCFDLISQDKLNEVIDFCDGALEFYHDQPDILSCRAEANFKLGHKDKALRDFNRAVRIEPGNPYRYSSRAYIKDNLGDLKGAIKDYKKAIELDPNDAVALNNLGLLEEKLGYSNTYRARYQKADMLIQEFTESKIISPIERNREQENNTQKTKDYFKTIMQVFKEPKAMNEFLRFIKNGLRLK